MTRELAWQVAIFSLALILLISSASAAEPLNPALLKPPAPEQSFWEPVLAVQRGAPRQLVLRRLERVLQELARGSKAEKLQRQAKQATKVSLSAAPSPAAEPGKPQEPAWRADWDLLSAQGFLRWRSLRLSKAPGSLALSWRLSEQFQAGCQLERKQVWQSLAVSNWIFRAEQGRTFGVRASVSLAF